MNITHVDETMIIRLPGQFYQAAADSFLAEARSGLAAIAPANVVVDFAETTIVDSCGVGALVSFAKECHNRKIALCIRNLHRTINDLFMDTGLDKIFCIQNDETVQPAEINIFERSVAVRLENKSEVIGSVTIFHLSGVMNHPHGSRFFKEQFLLAMAQYKKILVDLGDLTFFDSLSVSVVLNMNKLFKETGGEMRICAANGIVMDLFHTLNISRIIPVYATVTDALHDWL